MSKSIILVQCEHFWKGKAKKDLTSIYELIHDTGFAVGERVREDVAAIILGDQPCTAEVINLFPNLKTIARTGTGYNNVDLEEAKRRGIVVTRSSVVNGETASTFALGFILALTTNMIRCHEDLSWRGIWERPLDGVSLQSLTVGIVGLGTMGRALARKLDALDTGRILGWNRTSRPEVSKTSAEYGVEMVNLKRLMSVSDVVVVCVALQEGKEGSRHLINRKLIYSMRPTAFFVNVSRGAVVDEKALVRRVITKKIAGVALDVFSVEPPDGELWFHTLRACRQQNPNIILTPHIGSACRDSAEATFLQVVKNVCGALEGNMAGVEVVK